MESLVKVKVEEKGDIVILHVSGRIDATSSPIVEKQVMALIDSNKLKLVLNFEKVEYLSSAGMRLLLSATKKMKSKNGFMVVCSIEENVMEVIKMAGFDTILKISDTEDEAFRQFV